MNRRPLIVVSLAVVAAMLAVSGWAFTQLPDGAIIPVHWGFDGRPDGFAPKLVGLLMLPAITVGLAALLAIIPRFEPRRDNLERSGKAYGAIWIALVLLMAALHVLVVAVALGAEFDVTRLALTGSGLLFIVIGNYMPKVRPNYLMGIRTPWTLASDLSWVKTHRVGGRLFVIEGLGLLVLGLIGLPPAMFAIALVAALIVLTSAMVVYSYRVWKMDPARRSA